MTDTTNPVFVELAAQIVADYVGNNTVSPADLPQLIQSVHATLASLSGGGEAAAESTPLVPAVPVKKSVTPDFIICLEDGRKFKSLRRHLQAAYSLTPEEYRAKWGLPYDYPMVAPNYAASRSALAKQLGLGRKPAAPEPAPKAPSRRKKPDAA